MKKYYLDTNAVRRLGKNLSKVAEVSYTSSFTVFELLSGITGSDYNARKSALKNIRDSKLLIESDMPIDRMSRAFGYDKILNGVTPTDLANITDAVLESTDFKNLRERNKTLQPNLNWLQRFDERLSLGFRAVFGEKITDIKESRRHDKAAVFKASKGKAVLAMAKFISDNTNKLLTPEEVKKSYNGSLDVFIGSWLQYYEVNANKQNEPSPNDWADLLHLTYLPLDKHTILVTDDNKIRNLLNQSSPGSAISVDEFRALMNV
jgi:hypothetical protein